MRVVVVNAYNRHNAGDAALLAALIAQVHQAFPLADIAYCGLEDPAEYPEFDGARNLGSVRRWAGDESVSRLRRTMRKVVAAALVLFPRPATAWLADRGSRARVEALEELRAIAEADLVVGLGGGYLNGAPSLAGTLNVFFLLVPLWLATRLGRPTVLAPQSYGPFANALQRRLVRHCLNRVDRIIVREDTSLGELRAVGVDGDSVERGVDSAFAGGFEGNGRSAPDATRRASVGITARAWLDEEDQESYERALAGFIDWLQDVREVAVVLIPQVTSDYRGDDDRIVSRRLAAYCGTPPRIIEDQLEPDALRSLYAELDYLVGTRFHSVIFGLTASTPALAIEYEHKTGGIMRDLGLGEWVVPIREVTTAVLRERFGALEVAAPRYRRHLEVVMPDYVDRAQSFVGVLARSAR